MNSLKETKTKLKKTNIVLRLIPEDENTHSLMLNEGNHPRFEVSVPSSFSLKKLGINLLKRWFEAEYYEIKFYPDDSSWLSSIDGALLESSKLSNGQLSNTLSADDLINESGYPQKMGSLYVLLKYQIKVPEEFKEHSLGKRTPCIKIEANDSKMMNPESPMPSNQFLENMERTHQNMLSLRQDNSLSNINGLFNLVEGESSLDGEYYPPLEKNRSAISGNSMMHLFKGNINFPLLEWENIKRKFMSLYALTERAIEHSF